MENMVDWFNQQRALALAVALLGSSLLGVLYSTHQKTRLKKKELIAAATKSALSRVEMFYQVYRRSDNEADAIKIRDELHKMQEENSYYVSLLSAESRWLGHCYSLFIRAIKSETKAPTQKAWEDEPHGPGAEIEEVTTPDVDRYIEQFTKDSRRMFNYIMRPLMWIRHVLFSKWLIQYKGYSYEKS